MEPPTPNSNNSPATKFTYAVPTPPDVTSAKGHIGDLQGSLRSLGDTLESLRSQTVEIAKPGDFGSAADVQSLRTQLKEQDQRHQGALQEIQNILNDLLQRQVIEHLRKQVEEEVSQQVDLLVEEEVAKRLQVHIPQALQDEVKERKAELDVARKIAHNLESRRANAALRSNERDQPLNTIYTTKGVVSPYFPKTLRELFDIDAKTSKLLMIEYDLPEPSESKDRNLNRFMQFCGVAYQMG
ncbi:hypothetical protein BD779DRAFT_1532140 [Infundibulicybe gibba]|nr:hypothetical protein BD779DRAFT_1532140 [Infundibulicybe gibba]